MVYSQIDLALPFDRQLYDNNNSLVDYVTIIIHKESTNDCGNHMTISNDMEIFDRFIILKVS